MSALVVHGGGVVGKCSPGLRLRLRLQLWLRLQLRVWQRATGYGSGMAWHGMAFINRSSFRRGHGMHTHNYFNMQFALHTPFPLYHAPSARQNGAECASAECAASGGKSTHASASASGSSSFSASTHRIAALRPAYTGVYFPYNEN